jgi:lysophospholipase L1-like esterase
MSLLALVLLMVAASIVRAVYIEKAPPRRWRLTWGGVAVLWMAWMWLAFNWTDAARSSRNLHLNPSRPVVCIGDSLTSFGYPRVLSQRIAVPVIDLGADGITTTDALGLISELQSAKPQVVVIELGGHDFLTGRSRSETAYNLIKIIDACRSVDANVILMEMPRGFITDPFSGLERELARQYDLELISDTAIRNLVLWSDYSPPGMWFDAAAHLSDDGLHPNKRGNEYLANRVVDALTRIYGAKILPKDG